MSDPITQPEPVTRPVGGTEYSWCRAIPGGTGITVIALLLSKTPKIQILQNTLYRLQIYHPALRSKLRYDAPTNSFSFVTPDSPHVKIQHLDHSSTAEILRDSEYPCSQPHRIILEHDLNNNPWTDPDRWPDGEAGVFFVSLYDLIIGDGDKCILTFRLHTAACDRTSTVALLRDFLEGTADDGGGDSEAAEEREKKTAEIGRAIEEMIPSGKGNKPFWARGMDVVGYSLNSLRTANLNFVDAESPRRSRVVRLRLDRDDTQKLVAGCNARGMKLWAALAAAALIAVYSSKNHPDNHRDKFSVVTLMDCRTILEPPLTCNDYGFYHSGILSSHDIDGDDTLWDLAKRCYDSFTNAKNNNKHFTDMADLNFLMCKAIENPHLTPASSLRTASISIFEDPVMDVSQEPILREVRVEDYIGCASIHGVGPSIAVFDTIRDGMLDCVCVYPSPLHSREQMEGLIECMKRILVDESAIVSPDG